MKKNRPLIRRELMQYYLAVVLTLIIPFIANAQTDPVQKKQISGKVLDVKQVPVPGVTVLLQGTTTGTVTDIDGSFQLLVPVEGAVLDFSFIGFKKQSILVGNQSEVTVTIEEDIAGLEEVVVIGYGTQKKESLTSAISNIGAEEIQTTTSSSLAQKLQGKVPGLQIRQNSGQPGEFNTSINIRGFGGAPLYVIDGIPRDGGSEFQRLNPDDIESISVLKDASAAIYGVRAANGVIIVTTKKGTAGVTKFNYNGTVGFQTPTGVPEMASASQWAQMRNDAALLGTGAPFYSEEILNNYINGAPGYESTNWYNETLKDKAWQYQQNLSASGGNESVNYFLSGGYYNEQGLLQSNDIKYKRYTLRSNITAKLSKNLETQVFIAGKIDKRSDPGENFFNIFKGTRTTLPIEQPFANGNPQYPSSVGSGQNPVALANRELTGYNETTDKNIQSSVSLNYKAPFLEGLAFKGLVAYDFTANLNKNLSKAYNLYNYDSNEDSYVVQKQRDGNANISNRSSDFNRITLQAQASYNTKINEDHNLGGVLVFEQQQTWSRWVSALRYYDFYTTDQINFAGLNNQQAGGLEEQTARVSFVGRFNYDFKDKYLVEFSFREDGSYRYHPDSRWGFFPVGSLGWRISDEGFMSGTTSWLSDLKIRGSYGIVGEDAGNPFQYVSGYTTTGGGGYEFIDGTYTVGAGSPSIVNEQLTWFTSEILDLGFNLGLWDGRFNMEFDVYQRNREGLLAYRNQSLPNTFGGNLPQENLNSDQVRGLDFMLGYRSEINGFRYGISGNFNYARTKNIYVERGEFLNSMDRWRNGNLDRNNDAVWGFQYQGQFANQEEILNAPIQNGSLGNIRELPGDFKYEDVNGDGIIDGNDMLPTFWNGTPKMFFGLTLNGSYKGFDFNFLFQGAAKYSVRFNEVYAEILAFKGSNTPAYFFDRWRKEDPYNADSEWITGTWPASRLIENVGMIYAESEVWRRDASYVRFKSAEVGYTVNSAVLNSIGLSSLRVFGNAHNIFTITDPFVKAFDPEKLEGLFNAGFTYPLQRSFNFGISANF
ncbi:TonB-linked outer membrane protein, SusC/RagA family [Algoriphagus locisalis]|uniref:TonB-linked outer membrane protein, SusC/RagA family n=1 Tax=Algoriphagus locisalis TaxID=305507 RepID=A0A1I7DRA7_9BACT|nr:TonB-dependent receptor [Algoriphagus locisalis]SFU14213.1 TonB-linked outer membrane protein, SusC/RagA family [Algoriphagus locisalis]